MNESIGMVKPLQAERAGGLRIAAVLGDTRGVEPLVRTQFTGQIAQGHEVVVLDNAASIPIAKPYDVIHCHGGDPGGLAAMARRAGLAGRLVISLYGIAPFEVDLRACMDAADAVLVSDALAERRLDEAGFEATPRSVHRSGLRVASHRFNPPCLAAPQPTRLLGSGPVFEAAAALLCERGCAVELERTTPRIVGDPAASLDSSAVVVLPSSPALMLQAMARGCPIVADQREDRELVVHGRTGLQVDAESPGAVADAVQTLITDADFAITVSRAARQLVERHHDIGLLNTRLIALYRRLLTTPNQQATLAAA